MTDDLFPPKDLNEFLGDFSNQLDRIASQVFHVEEVISELLSARAATDYSTITKLQSLDYIRQSLEDLALLAHLLKIQNLEAKIEVNRLLPRLKLEETARLLERKNNKQRPAQSNGEIDLF